MNNPKNLKYSKSHEWVQFTSDTVAKVGLTDFAQKSLGGIVFINLPEEGDTVTVGDSYGDIESVKAVSDLISSLSGKIIAINEELLDFPGKINEIPYDAWLVEVSDITELDELLDADAYEIFCEENN